MYLHVAFIDNGWASLRLGSGEQCPPPYVTHHQYSQGAVPDARNGCMKLPRSWALLFGCVNRLPAFPYCLVVTCGQRLETETLSCLYLIHVLDLQIYR